MRRLLLALGLVAIAGSCAQPVVYDVVIRGGTVYDGSGSPGRRVDVAISGDRIAAIGDLTGSQARQQIDARGLAVAPGFINVLSWAVDSLIADPKSQSDLRQGVTLEVFGEGWSMGPLTPAQKAEAKQQQTHITYEIDWTSLGEYLEKLERRGVSTNIASFVGAATVRSHLLENVDREPTPQELESMRGLVRQSMEEGALGVASALIYAPGSYAKTPELVELSKVAAQYGGIYISHMRSEGNRLLEALDELLTIGREAQIPVEVYHLKAAGRDNWPKLEQAIAKIESARRSGQRVTANMYTYTAGATGLDAAMPTWVQEGGFEAWRKRLQDPAIRRRVLAEMNAPDAGWENLMRMAGPEGTLLLGFRRPELTALTGKTLAEVAAQRHRTAAETAIDLVVEDGSRVDVAYFLMSEENVRRQIKLPWVSFCSDAPSQAPEGVFLATSTHPRAYGSFARLLGKYVRDERLVPLEDAIRRLTALPAGTLQLRQRGALRPNYFADVVVFDPQTVIDRATYDKPQQYAVGMRDVFVNGVQVIARGEHTGATPGRIVRGPGWTGWKAAAEKAAQ